MGCTTTPLGYIPVGPKTMLKPGLSVSRTAHESPEITHKSIVPDPPDRRLRQTKSYTLPYRKPKPITDSISRSHSVTTNFSAEKGTATPDFHGHSSKRDGELVCVLMGQYMRRKVRSACRRSRWRVLQARFWSPLLPRSQMVSSCIS